MRTFVQILAVLALLFVPNPAGAVSKEASDRCPEGDVGRDFMGLLLCVPQGKERYSLKWDGTDWMAWHGDDPVALPAKDKPATGDERDMTFAKVWIDDVIVGTSDSESGQHGFDQFMKLIAASILQKIEAPDAAGGFAADVPVDESGALQRFQFSYVEPDLLEGRIMDKAPTGPDVILFRPSSGVEEPHFLLCGDKGELNKVHICMGTRDLDGRRIGILVTGTDLQRSFRIAEQVGADLESFVIHPAP